MLALLSSEPAIDLQQLESLGADSFLLASYSPIYLMACGSGFMGVESPRTAALSPSTILVGGDSRYPTRIVWFREDGAAARCSSLQGRRACFPWSPLLPLLPSSPSAGWLPQQMTRNPHISPEDQQLATHFWALKGSLRQQSSAIQQTISP